VRRKISLTFSATVRCWTHPLRVVERPFREDDGTAASGRKPPGIHTLRAVCSARGTAAQCRCACRRISESACALASRNNPFKPLSYL